MYENIQFTFKDGKIVDAKANDTQRINQHLDTDEGSRYVGEFAIGVNPYILNPMKETLFDEKIAGSIHFTPGNAYADCDNGNRSAIQISLVKVKIDSSGNQTTKLTLHSYTLVLKRKSDRWSQTTRR